MKRIFGFNNISTVLLIIYLLLISCNGQKTNSEKNSADSIKNENLIEYREEETPVLELDSEQFLKHINYIVRKDDSRVIVGRGDTLIYSYQAPPNKFISDIHYDRLDSLISFKECKYKDSNRQKYSYELKAWNYIKNETYLITNGEAYIDGEGMNTLNLIKYDPNTKSGVIMYYGYEWMNPIILLNGVEHSLGSLGYDVVELLSMLPNNEYILSLYEVGEDEGCKYVKYSLEKGIIDTLNVEQLESYKPLMIEQLGTKYRFTKLADASYTNWAPTGEYCFYRRNDGKYYFYYDNGNYKYKIKTNYDEIDVIWK